MYYYQLRMVRGVICNNEYLNELVTFGYIRQLTKNFDIPLELIKLIQSWYSNEIIHIIQTKTQQHWKIAVDDIISGL